MLGLSPETSNFITELDAAVEAHMDWTRRVLRCAVLRTSPGDDVLAPAAHTLCRFGRWFSQNRDLFEQLDPERTGRLEDVHRFMHDAIRAICADILAGRAGQNARLEEFDRTQRELIGLMSEFKTQIVASAAQCDYLTGLPLRHEIENEFNLLYRISRRNHFLIYVMMIDVDHFKRINDSYGHLVGDMALRHLTEVLKRIKRDNETLYRYGGEEFLLLMQTKEPDRMPDIAQRFIDAVQSAPVPVSLGRSVPMTVTLGLARVGEGEDLKSVVARADKALYEGKKAGRNCYMIAAD